MFHTKEYFVPIDTPLRSFIYVVRRTINIGLPKELFINDLWSGFILYPTSKVTLLKSGIGAEAQSDEEAFEDVVYLLTKEITA